MRISIETLTNKIRESRELKVSMVSHSIADADFMASAIALSQYLHKSSLSIPDKVSTKVEGILETAGISYTTTNEIRDSDLIIMLDVNNFNGCGALADELKRTKKDIIIIDHHAPNASDSKNLFVFNDESFTSTTNIIYHILKRLEVKIPEKIANLLLIGIVSDSAELRNSTPDTSMDIAELLRIANTDYVKLANLLSYSIGPKEKLSAINDISNAKKVLLKDKLLMYGEANIPAHTVADMAIRIGADVSIFYSIYRDEVSVSARMLHPTDTAYNIHLGEIMRDLATIIEGTGGGHPCAAGAYGSKKEGITVFINKFVDIITIKIKG